MNTQQAYIAGFVKRAAEHGLSGEEAFNILKQASPETLAMSPGARTAAQAGTGNRVVPPAPTVGVSAASPAMSAKYRLPMPPAAPAVAPQHMNDLGAATPAPTIDQRITRALGIKGSPTETPRMNSGSYAGTLGR